MENEIFKRGELIRLPNGETHICICRNKDTAIFAKLFRIKGGVRTDFKNTFTVSNNTDCNDNFKYERLENLYLGEIF